MNKRGKNPFLFEGRVRSPKNSEIGDSLSKWGRFSHKGGIPDFFTLEYNADVDIFKY